MFGEIAAWSGKVRRGWKEEEELIQTKAKTGINAKRKGAHVYPKAFCTLPSSSVLANRRAGKADHRAKQYESFEELSSTRENNVTVQL